MSQPAVIVIFLCIVFALITVVGVMLAGSDNDADENDNPIPLDVVPPGFKNDTIASLPKRLPKCTYDSLCVEAQDLLTVFHNVQADIMGDLLLRRTVYVGDIVGRGWRQQGEFMVAITLTNRYGTTTVYR